MSDPDCANLVNSVAWVDVVPWLLVIFGWVLAIWQAGRHDDRIDARACLDRVLDQLAILERNAITYHLNRSPTSIDAVEIKSLIERISSTISGLDLLSNHDFRKILNLRQAITLTNFDTSKHIEQRKDSQLVQEIGLAVGEIIDSLESNYRKKYAKPLWI